MLYLIGVLLPGLFFLAIHIFFKMGAYFRSLVQSISIGIVVYLGGMVLVMFLVVWFRWHDFLLARNASDLNYGVGLLIITWPFIFWRFNSFPFYWKITVLVVTVGAMIFSFSRMIFLLGTFLILLTFLRRKFIMKKKFILSLLVSVIILSFIMPADISTLWLKRLNIPSWSSLSSMNREKLKFMIRGRSTEGLRSDIWIFAFKKFLERPLIGHSLGSFPDLVSEETEGKEAYSGSHNLSLTVLVERGLIGFIFFVGILLYIWFGLFWRWRIESGAWKEFFRLGFFSYSCFLVYAHTTGIEAIRAGTVYVDGLVSIFLMVYLTIVLAWSKIRREASVFLV